MISTAFISRAHNKYSQPELVSMSNCRSRTGSIVVGPSSCSYQLALVLLYTRLRAVSRYPQLDRNSLPRRWCVHEKIQHLVALLDLVGQYSVIHV